MRQEAEFELGYSEQAIKGLDSCLILNHLPASCCRVPCATTTLTSWLQLKGLCRISAGKAILCLLGSLQEQRCKASCAAFLVLLLLTDCGWTLHDHTAQTMTTATRAEPCQILQMEITSHGKCNPTSPNSANESTCARAPPCLLCMRAGVCSCPFMGQPGKVEASHCSFRA